MDRLAYYIASTDNQFGFKSKHGTDLCIYALKEIVHRYRSRNSILHVFPGCVKSL
jgi:hypothetical protein